MLPNYSCCIDWLASGCKIMTPRYACKTPEACQVRLLHWHRVGRTGLSRLARPAVLEVRPEAQPVPPDAGVRLRQHGGHLRVPTHGVPGPPRGRREERLQPARVWQRPRRLAQGASDGGHPTHTAGPPTTRTHMAPHAPQSWKDAVRDRKHPELTLGSLMCQKGERADLDAGAHDSGRDDPRLAGRQHPRLPLPSVGSRLRPTPCRRHLRHPENVSGRLGGVPGRDPRLRRASRRDAHDRSAEAEERRTGVKEDEDREGPLPPMPHLDFAVCVEGEPCQYNYASKELEFFNLRAGVLPRRALERRPLQGAIPGCSRATTLSSTRPWSSRLSEACWTR